MRIAPVILIFALCATSAFGIQIQVAQPVLNDSPAIPKQDPVGLYKSALEHAQLAAHVFYQIANNPTINQKVVDAVHAEYDTNKDSKIDLKEFEEIIEDTCKKFGCKVTDAEIQKAFNYFDVDSNGTLDRTEISGFVQASATHLYRVLASEVHASYDRVSNLLESFHEVTKDQGLASAIGAVLFGDNGTIPVEQIRAHVQMGLKQILNLHFDQFAANVPIDLVKPSESSAPAPPTTQEGNINSVEGGEATVATEPSNVTTAPQEPAATESGEASVTATPEEPNVTTTPEEANVTSAPAATEGVESGESSPPTPQELIYNKIKYHLEHVKVIMYTLYRISFDRNFAEKIAAEVGKKLDKNNNGLVEYTEFEAVGDYIESKTGYKVDPIDLQTAFNKANLDGNAGLDLHEGTNLIQFVAKELAHTIATKVLHSYISLKSGLEHVESVLNNPGEIHAIVTSIFNGKTELNQAEFTAILKDAIATHKLPFSSDDADEIFKALDSDNSASIVATEAFAGFVEFLTKVKFGLEITVKAFEDTYAPVKPSVDTAQVLDYYNSNGKEFEFHKAADPLNAFATYFTGVKHALTAFYAVYYDNDVALKVATEFHILGDKDQNTKLDINEFRHLVAALSQKYKYPISEDIVQAAFHMADADDNNSLEVHEAAGLVQFVAKHAADALEAQVYGAYQYLFNALKTIEYVSQIQ